MGVKIMCKGINLDFVNRLLGWKSFNDRLALFILLTIPALWIAQKWINMPDVCLGATITAWTLVLQFYFRRSPSTNNQVDN